MLTKGQEIVLNGKLYQIDQTEVQYGGRLMVSGFRWIKSKQKFSTVAYIIGTTQEIEEAA